VIGEGKSRALAPLVLRAIRLIGWVWLVAQGFAGGTSAGDVTDTLLWVYGWVGLAMLSAFLWPVWHFLDPFTGIHDIGRWVLRKLGVRGWEVAPYPPRSAAGRR
jgi:hypothetical protein